MRKHSGNSSKGDQSDGMASTQHQLRRVGLLLLENRQKR